MRRKLLATLYSYQYLTSRQVADPYSVTNSWFIEWLYIDVRENLNSWFHAILGDTIWPEEEAGYLLDFSDSFLMAVEAGYLMTLLYNEDRKAVIRLDTDELTLFNTYNSFCEAGSVDSPFTYFPRSLNLQEFKNPFLVLTNFFNTHDLAAWKKLLYLMVNMSLSKEQTLYLLDGYNLLICRQLLEKFVDAMHVINIREYHQQP